MREETMYTLIVLVVIVAVVAIGFISAYGKKRAERMEYNYIRNKLSRMGTLTNYTYSQIVNVIGSPNGRQAIDGGMCCTWTEYEKSGWDNSTVGVYTIVLLFDYTDKCVGISSEIHT